MVSSSSTANTTSWKMTRRLNVRLADQPVFPMFVKPQAAFDAWHAAYRLVYPFHPPS